jgi:hypothetical protein
MITIATRIPGLETAKKIRRFLTYPLGWHFGRGVPPTLERVRAALVLNNAAAIAELRTNAFLGTEGEVRVTVYHDDIYLQFTLEDNGVEYVREEREVETVRTPRLRLVDALSILETFENELCRTSVSSTATTTIRTRDTSKTLPSKLPDVDLAFLWSSGTALST